MSKNVSLISFKHSNRHLDIFYSEPISWLEVFILNKHFHERHKRQNTRLCFLSFISWTAQSCKLSSLSLSRRISTRQYFYCDTFPHFYEELSGLAFSVHFNLRNSSFIFQFYFFVGSSEYLEMLRKSVCYIPFEYNNVQGCKHMNRRDYTVITAILTTPTLCDDGVDILPRCPLHWIRPYTFSWAAATIIKQLTFVVPDGPTLDERNRQKQPQLPRILLSET